jgi:hypothetical protein
MDRTEYMRLRGELACAAEARLKAAQEARARHDDLKTTANKLLAAKLTDALVQQAHTLIDELLTLQQREAYWTAQEAQFRQRLGIDVTKAGYGLTVCGPPGLLALDAVIAAEIDEMQRRQKSLTSAAWWAMEHKRRTFALVRGWIADLQSARRPGQGAYSAAARDFHEHGKLLSILGGEFLATDAVECAVDGHAVGQLGAVQQLKGGESAITGDDIAPVVGVA